MLHDISSDPKMTLTYLYTTVNNRGFGDLWKLFLTNLVNWLFGT